MSDDASGILDKTSKAIGLVSLCIAVFAAWKSLPADAEIKRLQAETARLDLALKQADADLKNLESSRKMTMELYQEVKNVITSKETTGRQEDAVRVLVEALADDPLRYKLLNVIATGAKSSEVKAAATETSKFFKDEAQAAAPAAAVANPTLQTEVGTYNVDIFYCESSKETSEPIARAAMRLKTASDTGRWRLRLLPDSINQQSGYQLNSNVLRYNPPEERKVAEVLESRLKSQSVSLRFEETSYSTPGYVSVFICQ